MKVLCRPAALVVIAAALVSHAEGASRYDPRLRFRTITTPRFYIHFHQGEDRQARRLARIAEEVAERIARDLGPPDERVHVILVDQTDLSNGWATPVPYNVIEITAAAPPAESIIGNTDDWLRLVFTHEYTHVVHLSRGRGWIGGLRKIFGRHPLLYPNLFLPLSQIEGIATYAETAYTDEGRVAAGDFRLILGNAAAANRFEPLDRASGGLVDWPAGHTPYLYGGYFHQFLADRYGTDALRRLTDETAGRLPYVGARAFRKVFGKSLGTLWAEFEQESQRQARLPEGVATRLTRHGFNVRGPRFASADRIYYSIANPHGFPSLMALTRGEDAPRRVAERYLGNRIAIAGSLLVYDQIEYVRNVGLQSDLYASHVDRGGAWRITSQARAADPDLSRDGRTIVCVLQQADRRSLATMVMPAMRGTGAGVATPLVSEANTEFASPRWSPDGRWIAAERRRLGGSSEIVLVDPQTGAARPLPAPGERNASPAWMPNGERLLFAAAVGREPFQIYSVEINTGALSKLLGTGPSAQSPDVSLDGATIVFVGYTSAGYDLFSLQLDGAQWSDVEPMPLTSDAAGTAAPALVAGETSQPRDEEGRYSPVRTLAPRFWSPVVESEAEDLVIGAATAGGDVLGRHAYAVSAAWSTSRGRPDWFAGYAYDRWWPTLFADASEDTDAFGDGEIRTREVNAGALLPVRRVRWRHTTLAALNASTETVRCATCTPRLDGQVARHSLRGGWTFDSTRTYGYSVSREDGSSLSLSVERTLRALGADGNAGAAIVDLRHYLAAVPRHGVVAARVAAAAAFGDSRIRRVFSAAGSDPQTPGIEFGTGAVGLLRGFEEASTLGDRVLVANVDYRLPLMRIERGVGTLPVFLRALHAAVFVDAGHAWTRRLDADAIKVAAGLELSADTILGYALPVTFTTGGAWRHDPTGRERGIAAFMRIGRAF